MVIVDISREHGSTAGLAKKAAEGSLLEILAATVTRHGDRLAIDAADDVLTYRELYEAAERLAEELSEAGVGPGDRVGIHLPSGTSELYVGILGVLCAGAAYVPVDADDSPRRAAAIWEQAGVCGALERGLRFQRLGPGAGARHGRDLTAQDDAWIIFTSGSTGQPKGIAISHGSAAAFVNAEARLWSISPEDRVLAGLSVAFDASCEEMWLAWGSGATLVPAPRGLVRAGADLGPWLAAREVSVISTVPTLAAMWEEDALAGVRLLILGGEACAAELAWRLARGREVWNTYGPTEATVVSTAARIRPGEPVTIGWPLAGWDVAVLDERERPVAFGEPGELVIGGVGLGRYLDPVLDAERYAGLPALGWERAYRSGDIVRETIEGLDFIGRRDDQVKLGGRRLELAGGRSLRAADRRGRRARRAACQHADPDLARARRSGSDGGVAGRFARVVHRGSGARDRRAAHRRGRERWHSHAARSRREYRRGRGDRARQRDRGGDPRRGALGR